MSGGQLSGGQLSGGQLSGGQLSPTQIRSRPDIRFGPVRYPVDFDPIRSGPVLPLNFTGSPDQENENFQFQTLKFSILKS